MTYLLKCKKCKKEYHYVLSDTEELNLDILKCPNCNGKFIKIFKVNSLANSNEEFTIRTDRNNINSDRNDRDGTRDYLRHYTLAQKEKEKELLKEGGLEALKKYIEDTND